MTNDRREFLQVSLAAGALLASRSLARANEERDAPPKLKILILGGTGFIGPALVEQAKAHGHTITLFNRGKTNKDLFPKIEKIINDHDPKKGDDIKGLEGHT